MTTDVATQVIAVLREHGPLTTTEIAARLPHISANKISAAITRQRKRKKAKTIYICRWLYTDFDGTEWLQRRAVYDLGDTPCVRPKPLKSKHRQRYNKKRRMQRRLAAAERAQREKQEKAERAEREAALRIIDEAIPSLCRSIFDSDRLLPLIHRGDTA